MDVIDFHENDSQERIGTGTDGSHKSAAQSMSPRVYQPSSVSAIRLKLSSLIELVVASSACEMDPSVSVLQSRLPSIPFMVSPELKADKIAVAP